MRGCSLKKRRRLANDCGKEDWTKDRDTMDHVVGSLSRSSCAVIEMVKGHLIGQLRFLKTKYAGDPHIPKCRNAVPLFDSMHFIAGPGSRCGSQLHVL